MTSLADPATRQSVLQRIARLEPGAKARWGRAAMGEKQARNRLDAGDAQQVDRTLRSEALAQRHADGTPPVDFELGRAGLASVATLSAQPLPLVAARRRFRAATGGSGFSANS